MLKAHLLMDSRTTNNVYVELEASFSPMILRSHDRVTLISDPMTGSRSIATRRQDYIIWSMHRDVGDDAALSLPSEHQSQCHSVTTIDTLRYIYPRIWTRIDNCSSSLLPHQQHTQHSPKVRFRVPCGS